MVKRRDEEPSDDDGPEGQGFGFGDKVFKKESNNFFMEELDQLE